MYFSLVPLKAEESLPIWIYSNLCFFLHVKLTFPHALVEKYKRKYGFHVRVRPFQFSAVQCSAVDQSTVQCNEVQWSAVEYSTVLFSTAKCNRVASQEVLTQQRNRWEMQSVYKKVHCTLHKSTGGYTENIFGFEKNPTDYLSVRKVNILELLNFSSLQCTV